MYVLFGKQKYFACRLKIPGFAVHYDCGRKYFALRLKNDNGEGQMIIFNLPVDNDLRQCGNKTRWAAPTPQGCGLLPTWRLPMGDAHRMIWHQK